MYEADRLRLFTVDLPCVDETWNLMRRDMHLGPAFSRNEHWLNRTGGPVMARWKAREWLLTVVIVTTTFASPLWMGTGLL